MILVATGNTTNTLASAVASLLSRCPACTPTPKRSSPVLGTRVAILGYAFASFPAASWGCVALIVALLRHLGRRCQRGRKEHDKPAVARVNSRQDAIAPFRNGLAHKQACHARSWPTQRSAMPVWCCWWWCATHPHTTHHHREVNPRLHTTPLPPLAAGLSYTTGPSHRPAPLPAVTVSPWLNQCPPACVGIMDGGSLPPPLPVQ